MPKIEEISSEVFYLYDDKRGTKLSNGLIRNADLNDINYESLDETEPTTRSKRSTPARSAKNKVAGPAKTKDISQSESDADSDEDDEDESKESDQIPRSIDSLRNYKKCTVCFNPVSIDSKRNLKLHKELHVLMCMRCFKERFDSGEWSTDEDGDDKYCRWCGEGGTLLLCSKCSPCHAFCKSCIKRNLGRDYFTLAEASDDWICFLCDPAPLAKLVSIAQQTVANLDEKRVKASTSTHNSSRSSSVDVKHVMKSPLLPDLLNKLADAGSSFVETVMTLADSYNVAVADLQSASNNAVINVNLTGKQESDATKSKVVDILNSLSRSLNSLSATISEPIKWLENSKVSVQVCAAEVSNSMSKSNNTNSVQTSNDAEKSAVGADSVEIGVLASPEPAVDVEHAIEISAETDGDESSGPNTPDLFDKSTEDSKGADPQKPIVSTPAVNPKKSGLNSTQNRSDVKSTTRNTKKPDDDCSEDSSSTDYSDVSDAEPEPSQSNSGKSKSTRTSTRPKKAKSASAEPEDDVDVALRSLKQSSRIRGLQTADASDSSDDEEESTRETAEKETAESKQKSAGDTVNTDDVREEVHDLAEDSKDEKDVSAACPDDLVDPFDQPGSSTAAATTASTSVPAFTAEELDDDLVDLVDLEATFSPCKSNAGKTESGGKEKKKKKGHDHEEGSHSGTEETAEVVLLSGQEAENGNITDSEAEVASSKQSKLKKSKLDKKAEALLRRAKPIDDSDSKKNDSAKKQPSKEATTAQAKRGRARVISSSSDDEKSKNQKNGDGRKSDSDDESVAFDVDETSSSESEEDEEEEDGNNSGDDSGDKDAFVKVPKRGGKRKVSSSEDEKVEEEAPKKKGRGRPRKGAALKGKSKGGGKRKGKRRRVHVSSDDSEADEILDDKGAEEETEKTGGDGDKKSPRKRQKMLHRDQLEKETRDASKAEEERIKRLKEKQDKYNYIEIVDEEDENDGSQELPGDLPEKLLSQCSRQSSGTMRRTTVKHLRLECEKDKDGNDVPVVEVDARIVDHLKVHQARGIKFMYDSVIENRKMVQDGKPGGGCILGHCMGLGKSLQVIALLHTIMTDKALRENFKRALVIVPKNTVMNWLDEFKKWLPEPVDEDEFELEIFNMATLTTSNQRNEVLRDWQRTTGSILVLGYTKFSMMMQGKAVKSSKMRKYFAETLSGTADVIVCDEAHLLKNEKTSLHKAVTEIKCLRRVCLSGTPLQNNLDEYFTMVDFVKPRLLGTRKEFSNRYANPIKRGQHKDSTDSEVRRMQKRTYVLHKQLNGILNRCDYSALRSFLPPKHEYILSIKLTDKQIELYRAYLNEVVGDTEDVVALGKRQAVLADFQTLGRVWTHPASLVMQSERQHKNEVRKAINEDMDDFVAGDDEEDDYRSDKTDSEVDEVDADKPGTSGVQNGNVAGARRHTRALGTPSPVQIDPEDPHVGRWWLGRVDIDKDKDDIEMSSKLILLFSILDKCEQIGDKLLVFSQSLISLDLIEHFLKTRSDTWCERESYAQSLGFVGNEKWKWLRGLDYYRLDGSTSAMDRQRMCSDFNDRSNLRARLFLISTKAGSLGINLVAANRVIVFDASWNPSHDVQSIFRVYRFGQKKPVYVYRLIALGTMEERIYNRQVNKESLAQRVIDEKQIERHFTASDLLDLYKFEPDTDKEMPIAKQDPMLRELIQELPQFIRYFHNHDSLLEHKKEDELDEEAQEDAWKEFEMEREGKLPYDPGQTSTAQTNQAHMQRLQNMVNMGNTLIEGLRAHYPETGAINMQNFVTELWTNPAYAGNIPAINVEVEKILRSLYQKKAVADQQVQHQQLAQAQVNAAAGIFNRNR